MWKLYAADVGENIAVVKPLAARPFLPTADGEFETSGDETREMLLAFLLKMIPSRCIVVTGRVVFKRNRATAITNDA